MTIGSTFPLDGIAIIGMAGQFPGARNIDELWSTYDADVPGAEEDDVLITTA